jgi:phosphoglycolate phosphatase-like HAD superfamily hydrolase
VPLDVRRIRALCFDVDGTLRDTDDQFAARLAGWLRPLRWALPGGDAARAARRLVMFTESPATFLYRLPDWLGIDRPLNAAAGVLSAALRGGRPSAPDFLLIPGVDRLLAELRLRYPLAVVSARGEASTLAFLEHYGLRGCFTAIATAHTCRHTKPYPDPVIWAARQMGVEPAECLMIGDTTVDIRAGRSAGAQTAGVLCGFGERAELARAGADVIMPATPDLLGELAG